MKQSLSVLAILNLLGAAQGLILSLALLRIRHKNRTANVLLSLMTILISIVVSGAVLVSTNYVFAFPHLSRLHQPFVFLAGPLLFLYVRTLISAKPLTKKDIGHFVPFGVCLVYLLPYYFQSGAAKLAILYSEFNSQSLGSWYYVRSALFLIQFFIYLSLTIVILFKYARAKPNDSRYEQADGFKVRFFVIASVILWVGAILRLIIDDTSASNLLVPLGASILVYAMGYLELVRPQADSEQAIVAESPRPVRKYERSRLTPERSQRYQKRLLEFMENKRPYLDGGLTVQRLAQELSIPARYLSQTINEQLGQSFSELLNSYRIEEAKRRLIDPAFNHLSILGIAEDVGFTSKSSFNAVFKKYTNTTPSEYRDRFSQLKAQAPLQDPTHPN